MSCVGKRSGLAAPTVPTLVVDPTNPTTTALVVSPSCQEVAIERVASEEPGEFRINAANLSLGAVLSVPAVQSLFVSDNSITTFVGNSSGLKEIDLSSNSLTTLDGIVFPESLKRLYLDLTGLPAIQAGQLPSSLSELLFRKTDTKSLESFVFPSRLDRLSISGNRRLNSLYGLVLPPALSYFECSDSSVSEIAGVSFPATLQTVIVTGSPLKTFDFRSSDLPVLKNMKIEASTVAGLACADAKATLTMISATLSGCAYSDVDFQRKYPPLAATGRDSSTSKPTPPEAVVVSGDIGWTPSPLVSEASTDSSSGSTLVVVGLFVLVGVVVGVVIGFVVVQRRRRHASRPSNLLTDAPSLHKRTAAATHRTATTTEIPSDHGGLTLSTRELNTNGFFENDVRNDPAMIAYRLRPEEIAIVAQIAKGGFGVVYHAKLSNQDVVVKQILPDKAESVKTIQQFMDEIRLHSQLDHGKIVRFIGLSWTSLVDLSLVMEHMPHGDLRSILHTYKGKSRSRQRFSWFNDHPDPCCKSLLAADVAEGVVYLHSFPAPIIHRDLKSKNVLLASDYTAKIGDFGISREAAEETMTGGMGTTAWIAPEVLQGERYSEKADIYSFGILMCELDACDHPYSNSRTQDGSLTDAKIAFLVSTEGFKPTLHRDCPDSIRQIVTACLEFDPARRPTAVQLHYELRKAIQSTLDWCFL